MKSLATLLLTATLLVCHITSNAQSCKINCPSNIIVTADKGQEGATVSFSEATTVGDCGSVSYSPASGSFFRLGSHSVIASSSTGQKCSFTITVTDNEAPSLSPLVLSRQMLWPASNKLKKVRVNYSTSDNGENVKTVLSVSSNTTDGMKDWEIVDDHLIRLKASRLADGSPRIYLITVTATDEAGNKTTRTTSIAVSRTMTAITTK